MTVFKQAIVMSSCRCLLLKSTNFLPPFKQISTSCNLMNLPKLATAKKRVTQKSVDDVPAFNTASEIKYTNENFTKYVKSNKPLKEAIANDAIKNTLSRVFRTEPSTLFCASTTTAKRIVDLIYPMINPNIPLVEVNPGPGFVTRELLKVHKEKLYLHDVSTLQENTLEALMTEYPNRIEHVKNDFFSIYKLSFLDRMDKGTRVENVLMDLKGTKESNEPSVQVVGAISTSNFFRHLIISVVFQTCFMSITKPDFFVTILPKIYHTLHPSDNEDGSKNVYRAMPVLFNTLFDLELIEKLPRMDFLPWFKEKSIGKRKFLNEVIYEEIQWMYLVRLTPKKELPCSIEQLPSFWYFLKYHLRNKTNRIIPCLEQWIPGCGIWLITNQDPPGTIEETLPNEKNAPLPHMNIFTRFSDLSPEQNITLFKKFISWPEFQHCSFEDSLDQELIKFFSKEDSEDAFIQEEENN